jgi:hypothetical protein
MPLHRPTPDGFTRTLTRDGARTLIESKCDYCGAVIVGSVPQLQHEEEQHRTECDRRVKRAAAAC